MPATGAHLRPFTRCWPVLVFDGRWVASAPALADHEFEHRAVLAGADEFMPLLIAEMRKIDPRRRVIGDHAEESPRLHRGQPLPRLQHRKRAEKAKRIQFNLCDSHGQTIVAARRGARACGDISPGLGPRQSRERSHLAAVQWVFA